MARGPGFSRGRSNHAFGDADVRVCDVKTVLLDIVQALAGIHARGRLSASAQLYGFKSAPGGESRWQIGAGRIFRDAEHPPRTSENMK
jgi:hypothetical protein